MSLGSGVRAVAAGAVATVVGARVATPGLESVHDLPPQAIFYANHSSHLDVLTLWAVLPARLRERVRPIAAKDYWGTGLRHVAATRLFHAHLVDRTGGSGARSSGDGGSGDGGADASARGARRHTSGGVSPGGGQIEGMTAVLDAGDSLVIFPEGTRGDGEHLARFHGGLYHLARHDPRIPVLPVALHNLGRMLPKGEILPVPHLADVTFLPALPVPGEDRAAYLALARERLLAALADDVPRDGEVSP